VEVRSAESRLASTDPAEPDPTMMYPKLVVVIVPLPGGM
jgi:hypothetical protein